MARTSSLTVKERNEKIAKMADVQSAAEKFGLSESHVYRIRRDAGRVDSFDTTVSSGIHGDEVTGPSPMGTSVTRSLFEDIGMTGLRRFGGIIDEEYDKVFKSLVRRLALYREMADDPVVGAVLQAIKMTIRRVNWYVDPVDEDNPINVKAAEFLEQCLNDMSISWTDAIENILTMIRDGFSVCEVVYKKRMGDYPAKIKQTDPWNKMVEEVEGATSKYDDGRIGWRKWLFMSAQSLTPGTPWIFDTHGGLQAINQLPAPTYVQRSIPIDKAILFRTTAERNNPEGYSLFRPMYQAWYMKKNLEEIEAISAERMGAGYPVFYAGEDVSKNVADPNSDINALIKAGRNIRVDEQMALIIPFKKMGTGTPNDNGVLFELVSPPGKGVVDFHQTISRYEQRMAMVGLAQFIHLGMGQVGGSRALGQTFTDFFTMSLEGWLDSIEETIHRYGTERLFTLNNFPGLTDMPRIVHKGVDTTSLQELGTYINQLAGVNLITPDADLEGQLRELADLPPKTPIEVQPAKQEVQTGGAIGDQQQAQPANATPVQIAPKTAKPEMASADMFFNQNHDERGRFGTGEGGGEGSGGEGGGNGEGDGSGGGEVSVTGAGGGNQEHAVGSEVSKLKYGLDTSAADLQGTQTQHAYRHMSANEYNKLKNGKLTYPGGDPTTDTSADKGKWFAGTPGQWGSDGDHYLVEVNVPLSRSGQGIASSAGLKNVVGAWHVTSRWSNSAGNRVRDYKLVHGKPKKTKKSNHSDIQNPEPFASDRGSHTPGRKSALIAAVNGYQDDLGAAYSDWSDQLAKDLAAAKDDTERNSIIADSIGLLLTQLTELGRLNLTSAWQLALGDNAPTPDMISELQDAINENDAFIATSLIPDLHSKLLKGLNDPDIIAALALGTAAFQDAFGGLLDTLNARVESYSGKFWALLMTVTGMVAQENGQKIYWKMDPAVENHCDTCIEFGDTLYDSMDDLLAKTSGVTPSNGTDCQSRCRCILIPQ